MAVHTLLCKQLMAAPREQVWAFFTNPRNLARITPPGMGFSIDEKGLPDRLRPGLMVTHRLRPLFGIPVTWLAEITLVEDGRRFIDEQRTGPFAVWHHEHEFHDAPGGGTEMVDRVTYVLPFGFLGDLAHPWLVGPEVGRIFAHRERVVRDLFPP